jgi:large-conductance mechanosensitive channel
MDNEKLTLELEAKKSQSRIMKKKILTSIVALLLISALLFGVMMLIQGGWFSETVEPPADWYEFAPITDFEYNVMEDDWYKNQLGIGPIVEYHNAQTGVGMELTSDEYDDHGQAVKLLTDLVIAAQQGDHNAYNACFSDAYFIAEGKKKAESDPESYSYADTDEEYRTLGMKSEFTMQQIYDVVITYYSDEKTPDGLLTCTYELKYKIHLNNGTLRNDMGSDCYRVQQIIMTENRDTEELEIVTVNTFSDRISQNRPVIWKVVLVSVITLVLIAAIITVAVIYVKRTEKATEPEKNENNENEETNE